MKDISSSLMRDYISLALYGIAVLSISCYCLFISSSVFHQLYFSPASPFCISILIEGGSEFALSVASFLLSRVGCLPLLTSPAETVPPFTQPDHIPPSKSTCWLFLTFLQQDPTLQLCCAGSSDNYLSFTLWTSLSIPFSPGLLIELILSLFNVLQCLSFMSHIPLSHFHSNMHFSPTSTSDFMWFQVLPLHPSFLQCFRLKSVL